MSHYSSEYETAPNSPSPAHSPSRPGRFHGPKSTWRDFAADEILLTDSLLRERAQDLSVHLYNAHKLKERLYDLEKAKEVKVWEGKDGWRREAGEEEEEADYFVPPEGWTAWPLERNVVPRGEESGFMGRGEDDEYVYRRRDDQSGTAVLKEVVTATILRKAKDSFRARKVESAGPIRAAGGRRDASQDVDMEDVDEESDANEAPAVLSSIEQDPGQRPVVSADDERSEKLLRSSVDSTLERLDQLLEALHVSRQACLKAHADSVETEPTTPSAKTPAVGNYADDEGTAERGRGRPRTIIPEPDAAEVEAKLLALQATTSRKKAGRPKKALTPRPGESPADFLVRIAKERHQPHPFASAYSKRSSASRGRGRGRGRSTSAAPRDRSTSATPKPRGSSKSAAESRSRSASRSRTRRLGLRDWSDVVGAAALVGWPTAVIERATARCTEMFGEGMAFTVLGMGGGQEDVVYQPGTIPEAGALDVEFLEEVPPLDDVENIRAIRANSTSPVKSVRRSKRGKNRKREVSDNDEDSSDDDDEEARDFEYTCPIPECSKSEEGFRTRISLRRHLEGPHGISREQVDIVLARLERKVEDGVHLDGFMRPLKRRLGWRGQDLAKRQIGKREFTQTGGELETFEDKELASDGEYAPRRLSRRRK